MTFDLNECRSLVHLDGLRRDVVQVAVRLGVRLELPTDAEHTFYGWRQGLHLPFRPDNPDHALVLLSKTAFNWRLTLLEVDCVGYLQQPGTYWCVRDEDWVCGLVAALAALRDWDGCPGTAPRSAGLVKECDLRGRGAPHDCARSAPGSSTAG